MSLVENFQYQGHSPDDPASEKQIGFISSLADERNMDADDLVVQAFGTAGVGGLNDLTKAQASETIEHLKSIPNPNWKRRG